MKDRFPRTVREFAEHGRIVVVRCQTCHRARRVPSDVLEAAFGADFDLYDGYAALGVELRCDLCGEKHRAIDFVDESRNVFADVSFEESVTRSLEMRALWRARDGGESRATRAAMRKGHR